MKRFVFNLQALLTLRQRAEQRASEAYAAALIARQQALERLGSLDREQSRWRAWFRSEMTKGCAASSVQQWRSSDRKLTEQREQMEVVLGQAELAANQALQGMLEARRDREAVEKHLQRQRSKYQREVSREDQKNLDELAYRRLLPDWHGDRTQPSVA